MLELCCKSTYLSFGNSAMLLIPQTRLLSRISDMTLCGHSMTICHLSPLALCVLCSGQPKGEPKSKCSNYYIWVIWEGEEKALCCCKLFTCFRSVAEKWPTEGEIYRSPFYAGIIKLVSTVSLPALLFREVKGICKNFHTKF